MEVSRDVLKIVDDLKADDPALEVVVINDSSESISSSLESVFQTMIMAVVVSMVIIWLFSWFFLMPRAMVSLPL